MVYFKHVGMDRDAICSELVELLKWERDLRERLKVLDELDEARREKPAELRQWEKAGGRDRVRKELPGID